jgi:hypothetical protein
MDDRRLNDKLYLVGDDSNDNTGRVVLVGSTNLKPDASLTPEERREAVRMEKILDKAVRTSVRTIPKK